MEKNSKIAKVLPFATTIFLLGVVFGASSKVTSISDKGAILMSALVFSGASQFAALNLWQLGAFSVILSTALLSSRFILMSASLSLEAQKLPLHQKVLLAFGIIDESYGLYISESYEGKNKDFSSFFLCFLLMLVKRYIDRGPLGLKNPLSGTSIFRTCLSYGFFSLNYYDLRFFDKYYYSCSNSDTFSYRYKVFFTKLVGINSDSTL